MRTKQEMFEAIRGWEMDAGESFLDYFDGDLNEWNFAFWALGKGYINEEQLQTYENEGITRSTSDLLHGEEIYSIVNEKDYDDWNEGYKYAFTILAEFLTLSTTYQKRVDIFLEEN